MSRRRARQVWLATHRWLAFGLGLGFVLVGLTGSGLVFRRELDRLLNPTLLTPRTAGQPRPLSEVVAAARAAAPGLEDPLWLDVPPAAGRVFLVGFKEPPVRSGSTPTSAKSREAQRHIEVAIDPASAQLLGTRYAEWHLMWVLYQLHYTLLLRHWGGETVVGMLGIGLLCSTATGLYLWWPRPGQWRHALMIKRQASGRRRNFDLHRTVGVYTGMVVLVVAFTGVYLIFQDALEAVVSLISPVTPWPEHLHSIPPPDTLPIPVDRAVAIGVEYSPGGTLTHVKFPGDASGVYLVLLHRPGDVAQTWGDTSLWIDQYTGTVLARYDPEHGTAGDTFRAWQFPLHSGEVFGWPGRLLVCAAGLAPLVLASTGTLIWWQKHQAHQRNAARHRLTRL